MEHKLSVLFKVGLNDHRLRLVVTGCVTEDSQQALHPLIQRAHTLVPAPQVILDLTQVSHLDDTAVDRLREALAADRAQGAEPVQLLLPDQVPVPCAATRQSQQRRAGQVSFA